jgi:uncharacterized damage-inducible protein DinB
MATFLVGHYRRWFTYEQEMHEKVLASLDAVRSESRQSPLFQKAVDLMAHIIAARRMWLFRFGISGGEAPELFPQNALLGDLSDQLQQLQATWTSYLSTLDDDALARSFEYRSYDGGHFRNTIEDILTQLFGHSWYHRGQIAALVRSLGAEPAITDFVFWAREPVSAD